MQPVKLRVSQRLRRDEARLPLHRVDYRGTLTYKMIYVETPHPGLASGNWMKPTVLLYENDRRISENHVSGSSTLHSDTPCKELRSTS